MTRVRPVPLPPLGPCDRCGQVHVTPVGNRSCQAHRNRANHPNDPLQPCRKNPVHGADKCTTHGLAKGTTARAAADRRVQDEAATQIIRHVLDNPDATPVTDPVTELMRLAGRIRDAVDVIGTRVNTLDDELRYRATGAGTEQLRAEVGLWERLMTQFRGLLVDLAKLGLEERADARAQQLNALQTAALVMVVRRILDGVHEQLVEGGVQVTATVWDAVVADVAPRELAAIATEEEPA